MADSFRTFISLPVPELVKEELRRLQNELRTHLPDDAVRWTRPEQVHLTLKFLGNIDADRVGELSDALREACIGFAPLALRAERLGFFPPRGVPRVLWVSVRDEREDLLKLQRAVETAVTQIVPGIEEERFTGHLTIGRTRNMKPSHGRRLGELAVGFKEKVFGDWRAEVVEVMRSELRSEGSRYSCLGTIQLQGVHG